MNTANFPSYFHPYIEKIPEGRDPFELLQLNIKETLKTLVMVSDEQANGAYAEGKWSIKEIVQHLIDTERIFGFRALAFARGEQVKIPGYDHEVYAANSDANKRTLKSLLEEFKAVRTTTLLQFQNFTEEMLGRVGNANGLEMTAGKILYILIGHELHHMSIVQQRYL